MSKAEAWNENPFLYTRDIPSSTLCLCFCYEETYHCSQARDTQELPNFRDTHIHHSWHPRVSQLRFPWGSMPSWIPAGMWATQPPVSQEAKWNGISLRSLALWFKPCNGKTKKNKRKKKHNNKTVPKPSDLTGNSAWVCWGQMLAHQHSRRKGEIIWGFICLTAMVIFFN